MSEKARRHWQRAIFHTSGKGLAQRADLFSMAIPARTDSAAIVTQNLRPDFLKSSFS